MFSITSSPLNGLNLIPIVCSALLPLAIPRNESQYLCWLLATGVLDLTGRIVSVIVSVEAELI